MKAASVLLDLRACSSFSEALTELRRLSLRGAPVTLSGLDRLRAEEASRLLDFFLHDPAATVPLEPFATLLAGLLCRREVSLWDLLRPEVPADDFLRALPADHPECLACACFPVCQGYATSTGSCATWLPLLQELALAARELGALRRPTRRTG